ncbi:unnamed protein product [Spirodela intermedia]|uniref:Uncharacterized protein n=1 Tax=Spirodela intermedia TaxID=51605 RepID=A0A7I8IW96_SPIIN|nr:unnamed protein product [Spirodela intermedia]CAA6661854.1 unnamed protein product [Spirodela intermedia]
MDTQLPSSVVKNITQNLRPVVCYQKSLVASAGVWLGDKPLSFSMPLLMAQLSLIVVVTNISHFFLRHLGQPKAVSQIVGGAILGSSVAGRSSSFVDTMFPPKSRILLNIVAEIGLMVFLFMIVGEEGGGDRLLCTLLPFGLMSVVGYLLRHSMPDVLTAKEFVYQLAATWARTSFTVLSCLLDELNLLNSKIGRLAMSATLLAEFTSTVLTTVNTSVELVLHASNRLMGIGSFLSFLCLLVFIIYVARPLTLWLIRRTPEGEQMDDGHFLVVLAINLACGLVSEFIGHHASIGCFLLGLALPGGAPLGSTLQSRAGFRSNFFAISGASECGYVLLLIFLGAAAKVVGVLLPCFYCKVPPRDTMIDDQVYAVIVLCVVGFAAVTTPILKMVYKPSMRYIAYKRRTVEHARRDAELRVLICVHNQENVAPIVDLLNAFHATKQSPICMTSGSAMSETDHIVKALRFFEQENRGTLLLQPFVAISPHNTMHDDVCTVALDKKVALVVLPFHKHMAVDGTMEAVSALKMMNLNVLSYAPCSVGILVDHGAATGTHFVPTKHLLHRIVLYFIGGTDDREALACAMRMAENPTIGVTVVRFRAPPMDRRAAGPEEAMDDEMVGRFRLRTVEVSTRLAYKEEIVKDGEDTIGIIRSMSDGFSLLVVGRRHGIDSPLTEGLSMWSEYPELGVLGDLLASTDFGANVSTLVVQQQTRVGADSHAAVNCNRGGGLWNRFSRGRRVAPHDAV